MKTRFLSALILLLLPLSLLADDQPARPDVDEFLDVSHAEQTYEAVFQRVIPAVEKSFQQKMGDSADSEQAAATLAKVLKLEQQELNWQKLKPLYAKAYADVYTPGEVKGMVAFYKSPAGQTFVAKEPLMLEKMTQMRRAWMAGDAAAEPSPTVSGSSEQIRPDVAEFMEAARARQSYEVYKDQIKEMTGKIAKQYGNSGPNSAASQRLTDAMEKLNWDDVKGDYAKVYADVFTPDETQPITQFYKSPAGQAYLDKKPLLEQKVTAIIPGLMSTLIPKIRDIITNASPSPSPGASSGD